MATSSKVQFKLETLKEQALVAIDQRLIAALAEVESYNDESLLAERIGEWRVRQIERLTALLDGIHDKSDHELAGFKIQEIPSNDDKWERKRAVSQLRELEERRAEIVAKSESLVPDADGNIALTKTQLKEFFNL